MLMERLRYLVHYDMLNSVVKELDYPVTLVLSMSILTLLDLVMVCY